jgi:hypothetical protein
MATRKYRREELEASVARPNFVVRWMDRSDKSRAGNPCRTRLEVIQFFRCYPGILYLLVPAMFVISATYGFFHHWDWRLTISVSLGACVLGLLGAIENQMKKFASGNVVPAFVLDDSHVAAFVNLSTGGGTPKNAVQVIVAPIGRLAGGPYKAGDRLPVTCLYQGPPAQGAWVGVSPVPVAAGTTCPVVLARVEASISELDWSEAQTAISALDQQTVGLHRLW